MTQEQLGKALQPPMTRASIANIEQGKQRVLVYALVQMAQIFGVEAEDLLPKARTAVPVAAEPDHVRQLEEKLREAAVPADVIKTLAAKFKRRNS